MSLIYGNVCPRSKVRYRGRPRSSHTLSRVSSEPSQTTMVAIGQTRNLKEPAADSAILMQAHLLCSGSRVCDRCEL